MKVSPLAIALLALGIGSIAVPAHADIVRTGNVPPPQDVPYPAGPLQIHVDATDVDHRIFRVHEVIPVAAGPLTLLYPQWLPGDHEPSGTIDKFAGLVVKADGKVLTWTRDPFNVFAFHLDVPQGVQAVQVDFQYLSPQDSDEGRVVMTPEMLDLQWSSNTLYPAGYDAKDIQVDASATFPAGWQFGTALDVASRDGNTVHFQPIDYNDLVDSPIYAGKYFERVDLNPGGAVPVHLDVVADDPKDLVISPEQLQIHRKLVQQMDKLYGAHHYNHYDFLLSLSDKMGGEGLEHHRSSENGVGPGYFTKWKEQWDERDLLSHEYNHSWDGKYRRPFDLNTPNFNVPMGDSLLWVYEGQTQFWGQVMAARSGLWSDAQTRDMLAAVAAVYDRGRPGLASWRNVQDTTNDPVIAQRAALPYRNYQGSEDYYSAGQLIWLAVDGQLRALTHDKKSIDDFARAFFGMDNGAWDINTYHFQDVVDTLNKLAPYDWAGFLRQRLDGHGPLIDGLATHGWKLVYTDQPSDIFKAMQARRGGDNQMYSIGLSSAKDGGVIDVLWDGPAFKAGLSPGMSIVAVNGKAYSGDALDEAITAAKASAQPIDLLVKNFNQYRTLHVDYHGGLQYPHLVRIDGTPDRLAELLKSR